MTTDTVPFLQCHSCAQRFPIDSLVWRCTCGGVIDVLGTTIFPKDQLHNRPMNLWRYRESLALPEDAVSVTLGEVMTPILRTRFREHEFFLKLEYMLPTGSYKDRGVAVCVNNLSRLQVTSVAEDSSGNAGASTAAYTAMASINANIYVPESTSAAKVNQIRVYGAHCHLVSGTRVESAREAQTAQEGVSYIGHSWNPLFACGIKTVAYKIAEQSQWSPPDWVVTPVGGGSLVLGLIDGFAELLAVGHIHKMPRILAVQSAACAPIYQAWADDDKKVTGIKPLQTYAEGIALPDPPRGTQVLAAMRHNNGIMVKVNDTDLLSCWREMAQKGIAMEPTSAIAIAGACLGREEDVIREDETVLILITGHGLKTKAALMDTVIA